MHKALRIDLANLDICQVEKASCVIRFTGDDQGPIYACRLDSNASK